MSFISALVNQDKTIRVVGTTTVAAAGATRMMLTIPGWPAFATLKRLLVVSNQNFSNLRVKVLTDGAAYRASGGSSAYVQADVTDTGTATPRALMSFNTYIEDALKQGYLYLEITATSIGTNQTFTVTAEGSASIDPYRNANELTGGFIDPLRTFRVLRDNGSGVTVDITSEAQVHGNPYLIDSADATLATFVALNASTDYLYVGAQARLPRIAFSIPTSQLQPAQTLSVTTEVWNGTAWAAPSAAVQDNTSDGQSQPSMFSYSGVITIPTLTNWVPTKISTDPYTVLANGILAGTQYPLGASYDPARYWIRFRIPGLSAPMSMAGIAPLK